MCNIIHLSKSFLISSLFKIFFLLRNVFENLYICENLDDARRCALDNRVTCATLRGQKVFPNGIFEYNNRFFKTIVRAKEKLQLKSDVEEIIQQLQKEDESIENRRQELREKKQERITLDHENASLIQ